ncbi:Transposase [Theobroma cacao]|nr:Transposase [Theobroma cacao]
MYLHQFQQPGAHMRCLQMMSAQFRSECTSNEILGTLQQTQLSFRNALGPLSLANDIVMVVSDDDASDQIEDDVEEDDTADWNHGLRYDCEDDYVGRHEDCSEDDRVEQTDIPDCNHADGGRSHTTTVVLEEVELDDHCRTVELEDVEGADPIYENDIRSPDDSDQDRANTGVSHMISFQIVESEEFRSMDDHLYRGKVFLSKAELKRAFNMLALKEHFEFRVKKSCHARFEVGCKDKACKSSLRATKFPEGEYWHVRMLHKVHTRSVNGLQCGYRTTSARVIGELISIRV